MIGRLTYLLLTAALLGGCSGSIYRQRAVTGNEPVAITVDARQRVLLSQQDDRRGKPDDPLFRRFCAEPSPDVFTVLGVSGSGGGTLGLGADKSVNAALQAAFSSSETGATIARTQTVNMLREMMFRTCERYLSGAISADEFPIVAARDQRIMVSILAIEQLTGSITPRALSIGSGGSASTGMNPTELVKALAEAQAAVKIAGDDVTAKARKQVEADAPPGTCATLRQTKAAGTPALTTDQANKVKACDEADAAYASAKAKRDAAEEHYDALVAASKGGLGISSAATSSSVQFASPMERSAAVGEVARAVGRIVDDTFKQDETQLFCIRALYPAAGRPVDAQLAMQCREYLLTKVQADEAAQAARVGLTVVELRAARASGSRLNEIRGGAVPLLVACAQSPERAVAMQQALAGDVELASRASGLVEAAKRGEAFLRSFLFDLSAETEGRVLAALAPVCSLGG